ncbi:MAG: hypothetical protein SBU_001257 [Candidatus Syntrophoarchaeum butanivorans]|uniref:Uncharacterized protein n=1 Tax=Candidatus Syntropharchaeum butanivorans TaxID=1839936 RepID=A0A1F2P3W0_9EURY|nr:MAG: hypothetical protein SBU_001257 [Candidatus Syntrophoarchaeum butanivorans]
MFTCSCTSSIASEISSFIIKKLHIPLALFRVEKG